MRLRAAGAVALCAVWLVACGKCGGAAGTAPKGDVRRLLPRGAAAVAIVPDLGRLGEKLRILEGLKVASFASALQGFPTAGAFADALAGQLGVDLRSRAALEAVGLAPEKGLGIAVLLDQSAYAVLPLKDEARLEAFLRKLATSRLGSTVHADEARAGVTVRRYLKQQGGEAVLGFARVGDFALVAVGPAVEKLAGWAALPQTDSMLADTAIEASIARLPAARELLVLAPTGSTAVGQSAFTSLAVAVGLTPEALSVTADGPVGSKREVLEALVRQEAPRLDTALPPEAFAVVRYAGTAKALGPWARQLLGPWVGAALDGEGAQLFETLRPGASAALCLSPGARLSGGLPSLDVRQANPFGFVQLSGLAVGGDAAGVGKALGALVAGAPKFGANIAPQQRGGREVFFTTYARGEGVHFAQDGARVAFGSPVERVLGVLAAAPAAQGPVTDPALVAALTGSALGAVVDLGKLANAIRALPAEAWGLGGFAIKGSTLRWLEAVDDLKAVTVGVGAKEGAVQVELKLRLGKGS